MSRGTRPAIDESIDIPQPIDRVWGAIANWQIAAKWLPNVSECEGPAEMQAGDELSFAYQGQPALAIVDQAEQPRRIVIRRRNGPVEAVFAYKLDSTSQGTAVHLQADIEAQRLRLFRPMLRRALARTDRVQLKRLKALLEANPGF